LLDTGGRTPGYVLGLKLLLPSHNKYLRDFLSQLTTQMNGGGTPSDSI